MSLIETMIALTILAVVIAAITSLIVQVNSFSNSTRLKSGAVALAQSSLEQVRGYYQQNGWSSLSTKAGYCYKDGTLTSFTTTDCATGNLILNTPYSQAVQISTLSPKITVAAYVYYNDKGVIKTVESDTYFYNY